MVIRKFVTVVACSMAIFALSGCGGGGGGGGGGTLDVSTTTPLSVTVIDGAIKGAVVCLDKNLNGVCDAGEPQGTTDASGRVTFNVANADVGQYPILAIVDVGAVDQDTGAVTTRYVMKAPKDAANLVTPLTTLVQTTVDTTGATTQAAANAVQLQLGITNSPLEDFTKTGEAKAQAIANAVVVTTQQQATAVQAAKGTQTSSGATITQADLDKLVTQKVAAIADQLATAATDATVTAAATPTARVAALKVKTDAIVATDGIKDQASASVAIDQTNQTKPDTTFVAGVAKASLANFNFKSLNDIYVRYSARTAAENTPDSNGYYKYRWLRQQKYVNGDVASWATGSTPRRGADLHWTGSAWAACEINSQNKQTVPDSKGNAVYNYCDGFETGTASNTSSDISSKRMIDVIQAMRSQGYDNIKIGVAPTDAATLLGTAVFPASSILYFNKGFNTGNAPAYNPGENNWVSLPDAKVAAGDNTACGNIPASSTTATLDQLVSSMRGTPCVYTSYKANTGLNGALLDSGSKNESWSNTTLSLGVVGAAPTYSTISQATTYYTGNTRVRVAFADGNVAKYYVCQENWSGSSRNCVAKGTGTYSIDTVGANKVMSFKALPALLTSTQSWERLLVQSGTRVFYGYLSLPSPSTSARLNHIATNALFAQLGMTKVIDPADQVTLTPASYEGNYYGSIAGTSGSTTVTGSFLTSVTPGSSTTCSGTLSQLVTSGNSSGSFTCSSITITPKVSDSTIADISFVIPGITGSFAGTVNYYTGIISGNWNAGSASGTFTGNRS